MDQRRDNSLNAEKSSRGAGEEVFGNEKAVECIKILAGTGVDD